MVARRLARVCSEAVRLRAHRTPPDRRMGADRRMAQTGSVPAGLERRKAERRSGRDRRKKAQPLRHR